MNYTQRVSHKLVNWQKKIVFDKRKVIPSCYFQYIYLKPS